MALPPIIPPAVLPVGNARYTIAYDFGTHAIEDDPPNGWARHRHRAIYRPVIDHLRHAGFLFLQKSVYENPNCTALFAYWTAVGLRQQAPLGIISTTVQGLRMFPSPAPVVYDLTQAVRFGGLQMPPAPPNCTVPKNMIPPPVPKGWHAVAKGKLPPHLIVRNRPATAAPQNWLTTI